MYQQYNQYQQQAQQQPAYQNQQQQASTAGMVWNGTAWVNPVANNPQIPTQIPPNPVQTFTKYYHEWTAREKNLGEQLQRLASGNASGTVFADQLQQRQKLESDRQWAKYYADESSRAAHHFYQNPNATSAPFKLPPAPPSLQQVPPPPPPPPVAAPTNSNSTNATPGSLTRFLKRNLELCGSDEAKKKQVQAEMEKRIATAIQEGNLQTKNWDLEPLLVVVANANGSYPQPHQPHLQQQSYAAVAKGGYYGPGAAAAPPAPPAPASGSGYYGPTGASAAPSDGGYYGPSKGSSHTNQNDAYSYYGNPSHNPPSLSSSSSPSNSYSPQHNRKGKKKNNKKRQFQQDSSEDYLALPNIQSNRSKKQRSNQLVRQSEDKGMDASAAARAKRANRFGGSISQNDETIHLSYNTADRYMGKAVLGGSNVDLDETDFEQMTVKGTCEVLEKQYLRLTAPPRPERVRPLAILQQHLCNLKTEYYLLSDDDNGNDDLLKERERTPQDQWKYVDNNKNNGNVPKRRHDYLWFCSQLKAVRQDCTVQRIQGAFGVDVYETHARIALQEGDLNE